MLTYRLNYIHFKTFSLYFMISVACSIVGAVCGDVHRSVADHMGFSIPCICSAIQRTALSHAVPASSHISSPFDTSQPFLGQCHFFDIICSTRQVLGERLQHKTSGPLQHSAVLTLRTQSGSRWQQSKFYLLWTSNPFTAALPLWRPDSGWVQILEGANKVVLH